MATLGSILLALLVLVGFAPVLLCAMAMLADELDDDCEDDDDW